MYCERNHLMNVAYSFAKTIYFSAFDCLCLDGKLRNRIINLTPFEVWKQILTFSQIKRVWQIDSNYHNPFHTFLNIKENSIELN